MKHLQYLNKLKKSKDGLENKQKNSLSAIENQLKELEGLGGQIRSSSKEAINASINEDLTEAGKLLRKTIGEVNKFDKKLSKVKCMLGKILTDSRLKIGDLQNTYVQVEALEKDFLAAREEFYEAQILLLYLKSSKKEILMPKELLSDFETYAGALGDFCGELLRKAKLDIIKKSDVEEKVKKYYQDAQYIYQVLANFSFSNKSGIRTKVDHLKGYIGGLEEILYDLNLKK